MFCPNCGTQNESAATPCKKCGFKLSGVSAPKFKGTMVLNSDQTVQELIEEHRRRQASGGDENRRASEPPPPSSGSAPPSGAFPGTRGPVLQPPRVAPGARRRMGGTMLGVAPQAGGVLPPDPATRPAAAPRKEPEPSPDDTTRAEPAAASAPNPLAGTAAMPVIEKAAADVVPAEAEQAPPASPTPPPVADGAADSDEPEAAAEPPPARRAIADTAPIPQHPAAPEASSTARQPAPAGLRPLDIVLIIVTLGPYGIVLWARQRKPDA